jgi:glucosamine--fructose-6-phosphate aminotransferase (isomerizing)
VSRLRDEIAEQPAVLRRLLERQAGAVEGVARELARRPARYVLIAARGSSDNAARYAQHVFGRLCGLPVALATPSLHTLYGTPPRLDGALVIGVSQSGASPDVVSVVEEGTRQGQVTVAVTNDPDSPLGAAAGHVIGLEAGVEASVAATKTYTSSLGVVAALAAAMAGEARLEEELEAVPAALEEQLARADWPERAVAEAAAWDRCTVVGRGANYGTAFEAALKIRELTGVVAEPFSPADFLHGPIAVVDEGYPVVAIAPEGPTLAGVAELLDALRERGATVMAVSDVSDLTTDREVLLPLVRVPEWLSPLVAVIPCQLLAVGLAERRGVEVDRPFGLEKITRTR